MKIRYGNLKSLEQNALEEGYSVHRQLDFTIYLYKTGYDTLMYIKEVDIWIKQKI